METLKLCPICYEEISIYNECIFNCNHSICGSCKLHSITKSFESCPLCRNPITIINYHDRDTIIVHGFTLSAIYYIFVSLKYTTINDLFKLIQLRLDAPDSVMKTLILRTGMGKMFKYDDTNVLEYYDIENMMVLHLMARLRGD